MEQVPDGLGLLLEIRRDIGYSGMADMLPMTQYEISSVLQICLSPGLLQVRPVSPSSDLSLKQSVAAVEAVSPFRDGLVARLIRRCSFIRFRATMIIAFDSEKVQLANNSTITLKTF